jgi:hypothetical protein
LVGIGQLDLVGFGLVAHARVDHGREVRAEVVQHDGDERHIGPYLSSLKLIRVRTTPMITAWGRKPD